VVEEGLVEEGLVEAGAGVEPAGGAEELLELELPHADRATAASRAVLATGSFMSSLRGSGR